MLSLLEDGELPLPGKGLCSSSSSASGMVLGEPWVRWGWMGAGAAGAGLAPSLQCAEPRVPLTRGVGERELQRHRHEWLCDCGEIKEPLEKPGPGHSCSKHQAAAAAAAASASSCQVGARGWGGRWGWRGLQPGTPGKVPGAYWGQREGRVKHGAATELGCWGALQAWAGGRQCW